MGVASIKRTLGKLSLDKQSKRSLWLLTAMAFYLILGALIFSFFEYDYELKLREEIETNFSKIRNKYNFTNDDVRKLEDVVIRSIPFAAGLQWQFVGAFYFCTVVITTVGYGHSTPATFLGKLFCMVFALIGIPLGLIMFQSVGERINYGIRSCLTKIGKLSLKYGYHFLNEVKSRHLLFVSFSVGTLTMLIGTVVFSSCESWSMFDAYYYCVITLSTIGFGDYVPLQSNNRLQRDLAYVIFTLFFILFGLAIFSACVNLLILEFMFGFELGTCLEEWFTFLVLRRPLPRQCMAHNADIVTARTRLRRLLSLRGSASFRGTSFRNALPSYKRNRRRTVAAPSEGRNTNETLSKKRSVSAMELSRKQMNDTPSERNLHPQANGDVKTVMSDFPINKTSLDYSEQSQLLSLRDVHRYYQLKPAYFTARRLPTRYIDHLVRTELPIN